ARSLLPAQLHLAAQEPHALRARGRLPPDSTRSGQLRAVARARGSVDRCSPRDRSPGAPGASLSTGKIRRKIAPSAETQTPWTLDDAAPASLLPLSRKALRGFGTETSLAQPATRSPAWAQQRCRQASPE